MRHEHLLAALNLGLSLAIAWACICRLNHPICKRHLSARTRYSLLLSGAMAYGTQPLAWGTQPTIGSTLLCAAVLAGLVINVMRWPGQPQPPKETKDSP